MKYLPILILFFSPLLAVSQLKLEHVNTLEGRVGKVEFIKFSADQNFFYSGDNQGLITVWDLKEQKAERVYTGHFGKVLNIGFSKNNRYIASSATDGKVVVRDIESMDKIKTVKVPTRQDNPSINGLFASFNPANDSIYFGTQSGLLCRTSVRSRDAAEVIYKSENTPINSGAFNNRGSFAFSSENKVFFFKKSEIQKVFQCDDCYVKDIEFGENAQHFITWCEDGSIRVWSEDDGKLQFILNPGTGGPSINNLSFTMDERFSANGGKSIKVWDVNNLYSTVNVAKGSIDFKFLDENKKWLVSSDGGRNVDLWKIVPEEQHEVNETESIPEPNEQVEEKVDTIKDIPAPTIKAEEKVLAIRKAQPNMSIEVNKKSNVAIAKEANEEKPKPFELPDQLNGRRILPIKPKNFLKLEQANLNIKVWDNKIIDGDVISLYLNDSLILSEYTLDSIPKSIPVNIPLGEKAYLTLHAHNLGTVPPNTADILVSDGNIEYQIELKSDFQGSSTAELKIK